MSVTNIQHSMTTQKDLHVYMVNEYAPTKNERLSEQKGRQEDNRIILTWIFGFRVIYIPKIFLHIIFLLFKKNVICKKNMQ